MEEEQKQSIDSTSNTSSNLTEQPRPTIIPDDSQLLSNSQKTQTNTNTDTELSNSPKKQKKNEDIHSVSILSHDTVESKSEIKTNNNNQPNIPIHTHYQDISFNEKNASYCSFSTTNKKPTEPIVKSNKKSESTQPHPIQELLNQASTVTTDQDSDEDEQQKKIATAKKLLFPNALATSFSEIADTLRNERRQEFCPIYQDETPEQIALRQEKQKPIGSLLAKRIRWDDLKRKREEEEKKAQTQFRYGPYGPIYSNQQSKQSFANPYEQYYATVQNQYEQMAQMSRAQQEHSGFWPEYCQQSPLQNNDRIAQNSIQQQIQPYTYPYAAVYSNNTTDMNISVPSSYTSDNPNSYLNNIMQPPPPPPDEPYPY
ncbi:unnamed protein product [Rotaria sp. Silwood2]|nr:unnamed protein product [Rotaria sp. Silwood2]CAF2517972.1 unnamed protein product [Rotaria sp. Silwood2]CAF4056312.1 unnamed protein product [Rotaria sp. Silwood2]CAF4135119.1 unnamed protein product [Rotaria sp. Silwood2]CAF4410682.1 unnamed protein product [Rotaria sp. Silwood2]